MQSSLDFDEVAFSPGPYEALHQPIHHGVRDIEKEKRLNYLFDLYKKKKHLRKSLLRWIYNIAKKFFDLIDDLWNLIRNFLPDILKGLTPVLIGIVGSILHVSETWDNLKLAYKAYKDEKIPQRKSKMAAGIFSALMGLAGSGLSVSLFLAGIKVGLEVAGAELMPVFIPGLLTVIYGIRLARFSYRLFVAKKDEKLAKELLEEATTQNVDAETVTLAQERYHFFYEQRRQAERKLAFGALETASSLLVTVGVLLGTAAIVGAGAVATMGILPMVIIIAAVVIGVSMKIFEFVDEKYHYAFTRKMKSWFSHDEEYKPTLTPPSSPEWVKEVSPPQGAVNESRKRKRTEENPSYPFGAPKLNPDFLAMKNYKQSFFAPRRFLVAPRTPSVVAASPRNGR